MEGKVDIVSEMSKTINRKCFRLFVNRDGHRQTQTTQYLLQTLRMQSSGKTSTFDKDLAEILCGLEIPKKVKISPDRKHVVYSSSLQTGALRKGKLRLSTLWIASTSEPNSARKLTSGNYLDVEPVWHPDGNQVLFVSDRNSLGKPSAIFSLRLDGGDARQLTPASEKEGISGFSLSPDGKKLAYISPDPKSKEQQKNEGNNIPAPHLWGEGGQHDHLRVLDLDTLEATTVMGGNDLSILSCAWSPCSQKLLFSSLDSFDIEQHFIKGLGVGTVTLSETPTVSILCYVKSTVESLCMTPNGKLYFLTSLDGVVMKPDVVFCVDTTEQTPTMTKVACGDDDGADSLVRVGEQVLINRQVRTGTVISDLNGQEFLNKTTDIRAWDASYDAESKTWVLAAALSNTNNPYEVYIVKGGEKDLQLSNHGAVLKQRVFGTFNVLTSTSTDGEVELDGLYLTPASADTRPDGTPNKPLPTFVVIHGGPNFRNIDNFDSNSLYWNSYLLSKGYGVLLPQYRGSWGRGGKFAAYTLTDTGRTDYSDVISITNDAIKRGFADKDRLIVGGWSNGGMLTNLCCVRNGLHGLGWRFKAGIAGASVSDRDSMTTASDIGATALLEMANYIAPWSSADKNDTRSRAASALWEVGGAVQEAKRSGKEVIPPLLMLHGEQDTRVPFSQPLGFMRAFRAHGLKCELVVYPGQGHTLGPQAHWLDVLERIDAWCLEYIGSGVSK